MCRKFSLKTVRNSGLASQKALLFAGPLFRGAYALWPLPESGPRRQPSRTIRSVAKYIAAQAKGQELKPIIIDNLCYMLVNNNPRETISVQFDYKIGDDGLLIQTQIDDNERREELWKEDQRWVSHMFDDFVAG